MGYTDLFNTRVPQTKPIPGREAEMVKNNAGGFVFQIDAESQLRRFLILGSDSPTYYASAQDLTLENAKIVIEYSLHEPQKCAGIIAEISYGGQAMRNDNAIFALALMAEKSTADARKAAFSVVNRVCRTGSHFMLFNKYLKDLGGKSNGSRRRMMQNWFAEKDAAQIAYQMLKYRNRYGWTNYDLLNYAHATSDDEKVRRVFKYLINGEVTGDAGEISPEYEGYLVVTQEGQTEKGVVDAIDKYGLTWEFIPSQWLESDKVWRALLPNLPYTALIRNLGQLTSRKIISTMSNEGKLVAEKLSNGELIKRARVHPFTILVAQRVYQAGGGIKGDKHWIPANRIVEALEGAFYDAFNYVEPSGKNYFFGIDASGSTGMQVSNNIPMTVSEAEAVMAMVAARTEENVYTEAYANGRPLGVNIFKTDSLSSAADKVLKQTVGSTDLAAPMKHARDMDMPIDCFVILTDNETWAGRRHPVQELRFYREWKGDPSVKMIVAAFTSTGFSIADPADPFNLDIVGLDTNTPRLISEFAKGL